MSSPHALTTWRPLVHSPTSHFVHIDWLVTNLIKLDLWFILTLPHHHGLPGLAPSFAWRAFSFATKTRDVKLTILAFALPSALF